MTELYLRAMDDHGGEHWGPWFRGLWPAFRQWFLSEGAENRPTFLESRLALREYMPEILPLWEQCVEAAGGGDLEARFLSLYCPPAYICSCSQAVWPGDRPLLVRNYDYHPAVFDALVLRSRWGPRTVLGTSDCGIGLLDGINDAGLALSLTFGGRRVVGQGFGVPIILRYVLQTCTSTDEAMQALARVPTHMAYNVTAVDARQRYATACLAPDRPAEITRAAVATNHQGKVDWAGHEQFTASVRRERFLLQRLALHPETEANFIAAFLKPPLYSLAFERGFGTLYTAALRPDQGSITYHWPDSTWRLGLTDFQPGVRHIRYPTPVV
jgi:predicted choloylglycine hydrolase